MWWGAPTIRTSLDALQIFNPQKGGGGGGGPKIMLFIFPLITFIRYISLRGELIGKAVCLLVQIMFKYFFILLKKTD